MGSLLLSASSTVTGRLSIVSWRSSSRTLSRSSHSRRAAGLRKISRQSMPARAQRAAHSRPRLPAPRICSGSDNLRHPHFSDQVGGVGLTEMLLGLLQHGVGVGALIIAVHRADGYAGTYREVTFAGLERLEVEAIMQAAEAVGFAVIGAVANGADGECVGANARDHIHWPHQLLQTPGDTPQQFLLYCFTEAAAHFVEIQIGRASCRERVYCE